VAEAAEAVAARGSCEERRTGSVSGALTKEEDTAGWDIMEAGAGILNVTCGSCASFRSGTCKAELEAGVVRGEPVGERKGDESREGVFEPSS